MKIYFLNTIYPYWVCRVSNGEAAKTLAELWIRLIYGLWFWLWFCSLGSLAPAAAFVETHLWCPFLFLDILTYACA